MDWLKWNLNGSRTRFSGLQSPTQYRDSAIIPDRNIFALPTHCTAHRYNINSDRANGVMAILLKDCVFSAPVNIRSPVQVTPVYSNLLKLLFTTYSMYLPTAVPIRPVNANNLMSKLAPPFILLGDLNAHNIVWESVLSGDTGKRVSDIFGWFDVIVLSTVADTCAQGQEARMPWTFPSVVQACSPS
jgi:hypothetical protein